MFKRLIRSIRRMPKEARNTIAMVIAGVVTVSISAAWFYHLPNKLRGLESTDPGMFATLKESFSDQWDQRVDNIKETELESNDGTEGPTLRESIQQFSRENIDLSGTTTDGFLGSATSSGSTRVVRIVSSSSSVASTTAP